MRLSDATVYMPPGEFAVLVPVAQGGIWMVLLHPRGSRAID